LCSVCSKDLDRSLDEIIATRPRQIIAGGGGGKGKGYCWFID